MALREYARKRNFSKTSEPGATRVKKQTGNRFVIQKHAASHLHYDFRLEMDGILKSWAVPKGMPYAKGEKRLAVQVEDHPTGYIQFEGTIPKGQYGGGTVMIWDFGVYSTVSKTPLKDLAGGKLHFTLAGKKLRGEWYLVQLRGGKEWLLIKGGEELNPPSKKADDISALSGLTMHAISSGSHVWQSQRRNPQTSFKQRISDKVSPKKTKLASRASPENDHPLKFVEPMTARLVESPPSGDWLYEIKFDGFRAQALARRQQVLLLSRNENDFGEKFPEIIKMVKKLGLRDAILDGEIVALDSRGVSSFQLLQSAETGKQRPPLYFYVFDLLRLEGKDLTELPLVKRKELLGALLREAPEGIRFSASLDQDAKTLLGKARKLGIEGLIGKRPDSTYKPGQRSDDWIKLKLHLQQEFVIGGFTDPEGSRQHFGALLVGYHEKGVLKFCGKVGTGFNARLLTVLNSQFKSISQDKCPFSNLPELRRGRFGAGITRSEMRHCHWVEPTMVAQVKFSEWTEDGKLRQPVFLGLREDKDAQEVIREKTR